MHPRQIAVYLTKPAVAVIQHIAALKDKKPSEIARAAITYWLNHDPEVRQLCLEWDPRPGAFDGLPRKTKVDAAPAPSRDDPPLPANTPWKPPVRKDVEPEVVEPMPTWMPSEDEVDPAAAAKQLRELAAAEEKRLREKALEAKRVRHAARRAATLARRAEKKAAKEREIPVSNATLMPQFGGPPLPEGCRQTSLDEAIAPPAPEQREPAPPEVSAPVESGHPAALPNRLGRTWRWKPAAAKPAEPFDGF